MTDMTHPDSGVPFQQIERATDPLVRVHDLALIELEGPDLAKAELFFEKFGLQTDRQSDSEVWFRAEAGAPVAVVYRKASHSRFVGPTFHVCDEATLESFAAKLSGAEIEALDLPGSPPGVTVTDPNGVPVKVACFADWRALPDCGDAAVVNRGSSRDRVNNPRRPSRTPSRVLRLGHMVLGTPEWETTARFYIDTFGLIPSDVQALPDGRPSVAFMRCDRGDDPADHHTFVVARLPVVDLEHAAFEVPDLDEVGIGGRILGESGFERAWGIGRHILGSQIFDYWFGPGGYKFEHFADGDLFDASHPTNYHAMSAAGLSQWGPDMPSKFIRPRTSVSEIMKLLRSLFGRSGFGFKELGLLKESLGSKSLPS